MKKLFVLSIILVLAVHTELTAQSSAQGSDYTNALGLGLDFGDGSTLVGISGKHFFTENHAGKGEILFGDHYTAIQAFYEYHEQFDGAPGLRWFAGIGAGFGLRKDNSAFLLKPTGGLDYKIPGAPLAFSFDWRPTFFIADASDFEPARFGLGFRFAFN